MTRAAIYLRVSTTAQAGEDRASLPIQLRDCTAYCERQGWQVVATEEDHETGKNITRKGYQAILQLARDHAIDHIVVWAPERFGRKAWEVLARVDELKELKVDVHSVTREMGDWLSMALNAVIGENELRVMQSRIAPAKRYKAAQGFWLVRAPFGTVNVKGVLQPGPNFDMVQLAYQLCIEGVPVREITRRLNRLMTPASVSSTNVRNLLTNPAYVGVVSWRGDESPAQWPPLIPPATFAAAGEALRGRYRQRLRVHADAPYWIVGLAYCGRCGNRMAAQIQTRKGRTYRYLLCPRIDRVTVARRCLGLVPLLPIQDWVTEQLDALNVEEVLTKLEEATAAELVREAEQRRALESERRRLEERIDRAEQGYLDGLWGPERVLQLKAGVQDQIASVARSLAQLRPSVPDVDISGVRALFSSGDWIDSRDAVPGEFKELLRRFIDRVVVNGPGDYEVVLKAGLRVEK